MDLKRGQLQGTNVLAMEPAGLMELAAVLDLVR